MITPFCWSGGGGSQVSVIEDDENELPVKCCGEALGTTDCIEMTN